MLRALRYALFTLALTLSGVAFAQSDSAADDRAASFQTVTGAVKEDVAGGPLMLAAYAVVWLAVFIYVFRMIRLQRGMEDSLSRLERSIGSGGSSHGSKV